MRVMLTPNACRVAARLYGAYLVWASASGNRREPREHHDGRHHSDAPRGQAHQRDHGDGASRRLPSDQRKRRRLLGLFLRLRHHARARRRRSGDRAGRRHRPRRPRLARIHERIDDRFRQRPDRPSLQDREPAGDLLLRLRHVVLALNRLAPVAVISIRSQRCGVRPTIASPRKLRHGCGSARHRCTKRLFS